MLSDRHISFIWMALQRKSYDKAYGYQERKKKDIWLKIIQRKFFCSLVFQFPSYFIERIWKFFKASQRSLRTPLYFWK